METAVQRHVKMKKALNALKSVIDLNVQRYVGTGKHEDNNAMMVILKPQTDVILNVNKKLAGAVLKPIRLYVILFVEMGF